MSRGPRIAAGLAFAAALLAAAIFAQGRVDAHRALPGDELLYLPNEKLLTHFTAGMDSVIADLIWLRCIQYTASELKGEHSFTWLRHMLETCVRLDPYFTDAYRYGGMFLAALRAEDDAALNLLARGAARRPDAWQLPYEMGMVYLLNRRDTPGAARMAGYYFAMSAARGGAPDFVREVADRIGADHDLAGIERAMWSNMLGSEDRLLRDLAAQKLVLLDLRDFARAATRLAAEYARHAGKPPENLLTLVDAGALRAVPEDPLGGSFFLDEAGVVHSTTLLDADLQRRRVFLRERLESYRERHGAWPATLDALTEDGLLDVIPGHPYPGRNWVYDPVSGTLN
jgi:hypothetical protein